uniref:WW domain-containing protein n=1 Tax=Bionectria ochroleuca TaxID=29856 RepID=A0A8H7K8F6_BIOOC
MSSQLPPEVPAGWSAQWSARHQTWVYVDLKSLNIQWMCPTEPPPGHVITPPVSPTTPSRGEPSVPAGWKPKWHQSYGAWYYVNSQTGKSQWNRPQYAAIPANAYSPIDHSHKPVDWDECAPSPLVTKYPKSLHLSLNLDRQPMSGFEHLFSDNVNPAPLTPGFFSPPPPKAAPPSPPRLCIDTKHAQGRQRPVSPAHAFIPAFRPRAISDCPPVLPDIPSPRSRRLTPRLSIPTPRPGTPSLHLLALDRTSPATRPVTP